jgi:hypothetical protein
MVSGEQVCGEGDDRERRYCGTGRLASKRYMLAFFEQRADDYDRESRV